MGNARARGTFAERKANPIPRPQIVPAHDGVSIIGGNEIRAVKVKGEDGEVSTVRKRFRQNPGLYKSRDGRFYRYADGIVRRATAAEIEAATKSN